VYERFDESARRVVVLAQEEARDVLGHDYVGTEHLLLGLVQVDGIAADVLLQVGVEVAAAREHLLAIVGRGNGAASENLPFTPRAKHVLELALRASLEHGHNEIGTEHVLLGLLSERDGLAMPVLSRFGVEPEAVRRAVLQAMAARGPYPGAIGRRNQMLRTRLALVEALLAACERRTEVADAIAQASDVHAARASVEKLLGISAENATQVLQMRFERLTSEGYALRHERNTLRQQLQDADA